MPQIAITLAPSPTHQMHSFWEMLLDLEGRLCPFPTASVLLLLGGSHGPYESDSPVLWEAACPALGNKLPAGEGHRDLKEASMLDWGPCKYLLPSWWIWTIIFHRGNCVYIVTVVRDENAMVCFDSSPNVSKCECACPIASCAKHSTECIVFK